MAPGNFVLMASASGKRNAGINQADRFGANKSSSLIPGNLWRRGAKAIQPAMTIFIRRAFLGIRSMSIARITKTRRVMRWDGIGARLRFQETRHGMANA